MSASVDAKSEDLGIENSVIVTACASLPLPDFGDFTANPDIFRGTRMSTCLQNFGSLWRTSPIDLPPQSREGLWGKSARVEAIDAFISQTWMSSGTERFLALLLRMYWAPSLGAGLASMLIFMTLDFWGKLPTFGPTGNTRYGVQDSLHMCPWAPVPPIVSIIALFVVPKLPLLKDRIVFFDAVCIHQTDDDLKQAGVRALGAFVHKSEEMIVLWCKEYFRRAWCVFELAVYFAYHKDAKIQFFPLFVTTTLFIGFVTASIWSLMLCVGDLLSTRSTLSAIFLALKIACIMFVSPVFAHVLRLRSLAHLELKEQLERFSLDTAICREDSDLSFIKDSVQRLYGSKEHFDHFVRTTLKEKVSASGSQFDLRFTHYAIMASPLYAYAVQLAISYYRAGASVGSLLVTMLCHASYLLCILPALMLMWFRVCKHCARQHSNFIVNALCSVGIAALMMSSVFGSTYCLSALLTRDPWGPVLAICLGPLSGCIAFFPMQVCPSFAEASPQKTQSLQEPGQPQRRSHDSAPNSATTGMTLYSF